MLWIGSRVSSRIPRVVALALGPLSWLSEAVPTLSVGTGAPTLDAANGSIYLRTDASTSSEAVYARVGGAWVTVAGATSAALTALAALTPAADRVPYFTGTTTAALATLTSFARTLLDDADEATARATLGVTSTADLASTANAKGASLIGVEDSAGLILAATVEAALAEIAGRIPVTAMMTAASPSVASTTFVTVMTTPRALRASTRYFVEGVVGYTSSATRDAYLALLLPSGATIEGSISHQIDGIQTATGAMITGVSAGATVGATPTAGTNCIELVAANVVRWSRFWFYLTTSSAGTLAILGAGKDSGSLVYAAGTCLICTPCEASV